MKNVLHELGLTEVEAKVYLALLKNGSSLAGKISSHTGIHRRTVYDAIERLIEKGLVSYIRTNNRKYFEAVNPRRLLEILKEKESDVNAILPELEGQFRFTKEKKETVFFRGRKAMQAIFHEQISMENGEVYYSGSSAVLAEIFRLYVRKFDSLRKEKGIRMMVITDSNGKKFKELKGNSLCRVKFLERLNSNNRTVILVYDSKLVIINWLDEPIAILIKEKEIADFFINYFGMLWDCEG